MNQKQIDNRLCLSIISVLIFLIGTAAPLFGTGDSPLPRLSGAPSGQPAAETRRLPLPVAYIYDQDTDSRDGFESFLTGRGFRVDLVPLAEAAGADFTQDVAIIAGNDTGDFGLWGTPAAVDNISAAGKPVIGIYQGGSSLFSQIGLYINWEHAWYVSDKAVQAVDPTHPIWSTPAVVPIPPDNQVQLYSKNVDMHAVYIFSPQSGVIPLGRETDNQAYYPLIAQGYKGRCFTLWGFRGTPAEMTDAGRDLFVNILLDQPCGCSAQLAKYVNAATAAPGDILNYTIDYELDGDCTYNNVSIFDHLPVTDVTYLPGSATPPAAFSGGTLTWRLGDLAGGRIGTLQYQVVVNRAVCQRQGIVLNAASLESSFPPVAVASNPVATAIDCRPVEFPTDDPPYAESEITVEPYPLVAGAPTRICTAIHNRDTVAHTVNVDLGWAPLGIGLPFTSIPAADNPRSISLPAGESATVCAIWQPAMAGQVCFQSRVTDVAQQFTPMISRHNLDVSEVLQPGVPATFTVPVRNPLGRTALVLMTVRNVCPGWAAIADPSSFTLGADEQRNVSVTVTPPAGGTLGSGCTIDIEAWGVNPQTGDVLGLIGGIRKIDDPLIPLGTPGEPPFAESEITVSPYPLVSGRQTQACVEVTNSMDASRTVTLEFRLADFGIGLAEDRILSLNYPNPQTVAIPAHTTIQACVDFIPSTPGHHCLAVKLTMDNGYETWSRRNLDVAEILTPGMPEDVIIPVANPTAQTADIDLVVDNTCPGWTATVNPAVLTGVGPNSSDVRTVTLTVVPPVAANLGTECHIDLRAYINGRLIGGVRKIDRMPVAPPVDEPHFAEREIAVDPDPLIAGQPARVSATLTNPMDVDQIVDITFAEADFGAGIPFTAIGAVSRFVIPARGSATAGVSWTPAAGGTVHRCLRIQIHQPGYQDVFSQRNVDLARMDACAWDRPGFQVDLPVFHIHNPGQQAASISFWMVIRGLGGVNIDLIDAGTGTPVPTGAPVPFQGDQTRAFFLRLSALTPEAAPTRSGAVATIDVLPYLDGEPLAVDGLPSGVRFEIVPPYSTYCVHVASFDMWWTHLSVVNVGDADSCVTFTAFDDSGRLMETYELPHLAPSARFSADATSLFSPDTFNRSLWLRINSQSEIRGVLEFGTRDDETYVVMPMLAATRGSLVFPYVYSTPPGSGFYYTGLGIVNTSPWPAPITLQAHSQDGLVLDTRTTTIPAMGKYVRLIEEMFTVPDVSSIRMVRVGSYSPLVGFELFGKWEDLGLAGLPACTASGPLSTAPASKIGLRQDPGAGTGPVESLDAPRHILYYNEIPDPSFYYTGVTFSNLDDTPGVLTAQLYDKFGNLLREQEWPVNPLQQITREIWNVFPPGDAQPSAATMRVFSDHAMLGFELYLTRTVGPGAAFQFDGLSAVPNGAREIYFPLIKDGSDFSVQFRLTNPGAISSSYSLTAYSSAGESIETVLRTIDAGCTQELNLSVFSAPAATIAWIKVDSQEPLIGNASIVSTDLTSLGSYLGLE